MTPAAPALAELSVGGSSGPWERLGFRVEDDSCSIGTTTLRFVGGTEGGIREWHLTGEGTTDVDGLPTRWVTPRGQPPGGADHPNGARKLDHVVVTTPDVGRTTAALESLGIACRRLRDTETGRPARPLRQAFFRLGEVILEVVGPRTPEGDRPAAFWGLVVVVADLEACARRLGAALGDIRDAVQPGRRIATVRRSAEVEVPLAFMTPHPRR